MDNYVSFFIGETYIIHTPLCLIKPFFLFFWNGVGYGGPLRLVCNQSNGRKADKNDK